MFFYLLKLVKNCAIGNKRLFLSIMLKNKILLLVFLLCALFAACEKTPPYEVEKQKELDAITIKKYVDSNNLSMIVDPSGLNYQIITPGKGTVYPTPTDSVMVYFQGRLLRASSAFQTVAETDSLGVNLNYAMEGWKIGLSKITAGGQIRMIIPSALAYKNFTGNGIPPFAILDYTITLKNIKYKTENTK